MDSAAKQPSRAEVNEQQRQAEVLQRQAAGHLDRAITTRNQLETIRRVNGIAAAIQKRRTG